MLALSRQNFLCFAPRKAIFQDPIIVYVSNIVVTQQQIPQPIRTAAFYLMVFQFLVYLLCCLLRTVCVTVAEESFQGELLCRNVAGISRASRSMCFLFVYVLVFRH
jgi:hypothetical protein